VFSKLVSASPPHVDLTVLASTSFLLLLWNFNFTTPYRWSVFLLVPGFYLHSSFSQWFLPPSLFYFLATLQLFYPTTILLPKGRQEGEKVSKCLSLYCKLWATVVHSRGTLGSYVVRSRDENSLRGCSLPKKPTITCIRVEYWIISTHVYILASLTAIVNSKILNAERTTNVTKQVTKLSGTKSLRS